MVRLLRTMLRLSRRELACRSGVSVRELARIDDGEVMPRREAWDRLNRAFFEAVLERASGQQSARRP